MTQRGKHTDNRVSGAAHKQAMREQLWKGVFAGFSISCLLFAAMTWLLYGGNR